MRYSNRFCLPRKKETEKPAILAVLQAITKDDPLEDLVAFERLSLRGHLLIHQGRDGGVRLRIRLGGFRGRPFFTADEDGPMRLVGLPPEQADQRRNGEDTQKRQHPYSLAAY